MSSAPVHYAAAICPQCGSAIAPTLLSCPGCNRLVHAEKLSALAAAAQQAAERGDDAAQLAAWQEAATFLPTSSRQFTVVTEKIALLNQTRGNSSTTRSAVALSSAQTSTPTTNQTEKSKAGKIAAGLGVVALLLWKLKAVLVFAVTKGKLLLAGLTKGSTFFSMLLSTGVYWTAWGWQFAVGLVLSIYVHEMGHVAELRRFGINASAPMFIPGIGAVVRLKQHITDPRQDARVGLAGPIWGTAAAVVTYCVGNFANWPLWLAIAKVGAWINLFNLAPVWQLDGGRAFSSMNRGQRWLAALAVLIAWVLTHEGLLVLLTLFAVGSALAAKPKSSDPGALAWYVGLIAVLSMMCLIHVPMNGLQ